MSSFHIPVTINIAEHIEEQMRDHERIHCIKSILASISEEGTIQKIRALVNDPKHNDQEPA